MDNKFVRKWFFTKPEAISRCLSNVFYEWGFLVTWNKSFESESQYLSVCFFNEGIFRMIKIRISDHSFRTNNFHMPFDVDVYVTFERDGATSYVKLLSKLSQKLNKPLPLALEKIKSGTHEYMRYKYEMRRRRKIVGANGHFHAGDKFFV